MPNLKALTQNISVYMDEYSTNNENMGSTLKSFQSGSGQLCNRLMMCSTVKDQLLLRLNGMDMEVEQFNYSVKTMTIGLNECRIKG